MLAGQGTISPSLEDPLSLARQLTENLNGPQEAARIHQIRDYLSQIQSTRAKELNDSQNLLKSLSRQLEIAKENAERPARELNATQHVQRISALGTERSSVTKELAAGEATIEVLEEELRRLEEERDSILKEHEKEANMPPDEQILKLQIYKSLDIDFQKDETGKFTKATVRSAKDKDIHTYDLSPNYSRFFYANILWDLCQ
ncbi:kinetochore-associated Ndc80 complex subunit spc24 [Rhizophlyctis rosea]|uniref:Kinetochore protein Spc24 n=1 Tax=Rhizophlyctis rosea TaxID=64517 RepID=A0AAD5X6K7_9FUNG|nr:kinetochore-associated Ndc80 complex subunit spc24 [Rhizophlyctis rosea]